MAGAGSPSMHFLRLVLFGVAAIAVLASAATFLGPARRLEKMPDPGPESRVAEEPVSEEKIAAARREIEEKLAAAAEYAGVIEPLRRYFPVEYETFLAKSAELSATGDASDPDVILAEAIRALRSTHGVLAAKADASALEQFFVLQRALVQALAGESQHLCVDFLYGDTSREFFRFSENNRPLVASLALATIEAIRDGQIEQIDRPQPTRQDLQLLEDAMQSKGLDTPAIEAILDGKVGDPPLDEATLCRAGLVYLDALAELPEPARTRIYALAIELMARS